MFCVFGFSCLLVYVVFAVLFSYVFIDLGLEIRLPVIVAVLLCFRRVDYELCFLWVLFSCCLLFVLLFDAHLVCFDLCN